MRCLNINYHVAWWKLRKYLATLRCHLTRLAKFSKILCEKNRISNYLHRLPPPPPPPGAANRKLWSKRVKNRRLVRNILQKKCCRKIYIRVHVWRFATRQKTSTSTRFFFFFFFASYLFTPNDTNNIRMCAKPLNYACVYKFSLFVVIDLHSGVQLKLLSYMMFDKWG